MRLGRRPRSSGVTLSIARTARTAGTARTRVARHLSRYFAPPCMPVFAGAAVSWRVTWPHYDGLWWGLFGSGAWALLSAAVAFSGTRLRWWPAPDPSERRPRLMLLAASVITAVAVWLVCDRLGAPATLLAMGCMAPLLATLLFACTYAGNISLHVSSAAASVTLLTLQLGPPWALLYFLVAAIGWSRLHLRAHTLTQVVAGAAAGTMVCSTMHYFGPLGAR